MWRNNRLNRSQLSVLASVALLFLCSERGYGFGFREDAIHYSAHGGLGGLVTGFQFSHRLPRWDVPQSKDPAERRRLEVEPNSLGDTTDYSNSSWSLGYAFRAAPLTVGGTSRLAYSSSLGASAEGIVFTRFILGAEIEADFSHTEAYNHGTLQFSLEYVQDLRPQMRSLSQKRLIEYFIGETEKIQHPNVHFGFVAHFQRHQRVTSESYTPSWVPSATAAVDTTVSGIGPTFTYEFGPFTFFKLSLMGYLYDSDLGNVTSVLSTSDTSRIPPLQSPLGVLRGSGYFGFFPKWTFDEQFSWQLGENWRLELLLSQVLYRDGSKNKPSLSANPALHATVFGKWRPGLYVDFTYAFQSIYVLGGLSIKYLW